MAEGTADEELIWHASAQVVAEICKHEDGIDSTKTEKKLRDYCRKAAKGMEFGRKRWMEVVNDYADAVMSVIFTTFADKPWLEEVDFLLVLDAGVKDNFPPKILKDIPPAALERTILAAHDRAFEEQRYLPLLWETCVQSIEGTTTRKKVYHACEFGRKMAAVPNVEASNPMEDYVSRWIDESIYHFSKKTGRNPAWNFPVEQATELFHTLIEAGAIPYGLREAHGATPSRWPFVDEVVQTSYEKHSEQEAMGTGGLAQNGASAKKNGKGQKRAASAAFGGEPAEAAEVEESAEFPGLTEAADLANGAESEDLAELVVLADPAEEEPQADDSGVDSGSGCGEPPAKLLKTGSFGKTDSNKSKDWSKGAGATAGWGVGAWAKGELSKGGWCKAGTGKATWGKPEWGKGGWGMGEWGKADWGKGGWGKAGWAKGAAW